MILTVAPANAVNPTLTASLSPESANAGASTAFTLNVTADQGTMRTLNLAAPSGFAINVASVVASSGSTSGSSPSQIQVTGLRISGSTALTVTFEAWAACTPGTYGWNLTATQKGGPYVPVTLNTPVTLPSSCSLSFAPGQPASAVVDQTITTVLYSVARDVSSTPVAVSALRGDGNVDPSFVGTITLSIFNDPGPDDATLGGGIASAASGGTATFTPSIDTAGGGYVLGATNPDVNDAGEQFTSDSFAIQSTVEVCAEAAPCETEPTSGADITTQARANTPTPGQAITSSVSEGDIDCTALFGYNEVSTDEVTTEYTGTGTVLVTDTIPASLVHSDTTNGIGQIRTCFLSSHFFAGSQPAPNRPGFFIGLLSNCGKKRVVAPCETSKRETTGGVGIIEYLIDAGDPGGRH